MKGEEVSCSTKPESRVALLSAQRGCEAADPEGVTSLEAQHTSSTCECFPYMQCPQVLCRQKNAPLTVTPEKGALQLCSEHTLRPPGLTLILERVARPDLHLPRTTTNNLRSAGFLCRTYALCGFLVPTAFRPQSS